MMQDHINKKTASIATAVLLFATGFIIVIPIVPQAFALSAVTITASPMTAGATATYTISFTTSTPSVSISTILIVFPDGVNTIGATLIGQTNLGAGSLTSVSAQRVEYILAGAGPPPGTPVSLRIGNIVNAGAANTYTLTIEVINPIGNIVEIGSGSVVPAVGIFIPSAQAVSNLKGTFTSANMQVPDYGTSFTPSILAAYPQAMDAHILFYTGCDPNGGSQDPGCDVNTPYGLQWAIAQAMANGFGGVLYDNEPQGSNGALSTPAQEYDPNVSTANPPPGVSISAYYANQAAAQVKQANPNLKFGIAPAQALYTGLNFPSVLTGLDWSNIDFWQIQTGCRMPAQVISIAQTYAAPIKQAHPQVKIYIAVDELPGMCLPTYTTQDIVNIIQNTAGLVDGVELHLYDKCTNPSISSVLVALGRPGQVVICGVANTNTAFVSGITIITGSDPLGKTLMEVTLPPGTTITSAAAASYSANAGNNIAQVSGLIVPYPPGKSIKMLSDPGATSVCIIDSSIAAKLSGLSCQTDTANSEVLLDCPTSGNAQTFAGFPTAPTSRTYTCTKTTESRNTYMKVDGLVNCIVIGGTLPIVIQFTTATVLSSSASATAFGQPVNFTSSVSVNAPASGTPTGNVKFYDNGTTLLGTASLNNTGQASLPSVSTLALGTHEITAAYSGDGNFTASTSSVLEQIVIDVGPPVVTGTPDRAPDSNGFYNHLVTITWTGNDTDGGSITSCDSPTKYSGPDGKSLTTKGHCRDDAGNVGKGNFAFNYDSTPPIITSSQQGQNFTLNQKVAPSFNCADTTSGILPGNCGTPITSLDTSTTGQHSYLITGTDNAGNKATLTVNYHVSHQALLYMVVLPAGTGVPSIPQMFDANGQFGGDDTTLPSGPQMFGGNAGSDDSTVQSIPTKQLFNGNQNIPWGKSAFLAGFLFDNNTKTLIANAVISFGGNGSSGFPPGATTNSFGFFFAKGTVPSSIGMWTLTASYAGDAIHHSASVTRIYNTIKHHTSLSLSVVPAHAKLGTNFSVKGVLVDLDTGTGIAAETVKFTASVPISIVPASTSSTGVYSVQSLSAPSAKGSYSIQAMFTGDSLYAPASSPVKKLFVS